MHTAHTVKAAATTKGNVPKNIKMGKGGAKQGSKGR